MRHNLSFDGRRLSIDAAAGRSFRADPRCLAGDGTPAYAHICALADPSAAVPFDDPAVQGARQAALAWWIPLLGDDLLCLTTLALDESRCAGAITVARNSRHFDSDPFAQLFVPTVVETTLFSLVPAPPGPVIERYSGEPWPAEGFG